MHRLLTAAAFACGALAVLPARAGWQDTPDTLRLQAVGDALRVNGTPMQVRAFVSAQPMEALLRDVQSGWERNRDRTSVTRDKVGSWTVLNQTVGAQHRSFQVREGGGRLEGYVSLTSPREARAPKLAVALPSGMTAVSIIDSMDEGRASQQVIAVSTRSVEASAQALEATLKASGWERHVYRKSGQGLTYAANKGGQEFDAVISSQKNGSLVMLNTK